MRSQMIRRDMLWCAAVLATAVITQPVVHAQQQKPHHVIFAKVHSAALEENLLGDSAERNVTIYLPPGYDDSPGQRYPVLYLLHGYIGSNYFWVDDTYVDHEVNVASIADALIWAGRVKPMIIVCPDGRNRYRGSWYMNSPVTGKWEDFITKELVGYVDSTFRTLASKDSRGIGGLSMGGHGALYLATRNPHVYGAVYAMSPAWIVFSQAILKTNNERIRVLLAKEHPRFDEQEWQTQASIALAAAVSPNPEKPPFFVDFPQDANGKLDDGIWQRWLVHDPYTMIEKHRDNLLELRGIGLECGTADDLLPESQLYSKALMDAGITHSYEEFDGGHVDRVAQRLKLKVLPFFSETLKFE